jgi:tetratricopeptide (TPR) repeat protein
MMNNTIRSKDNAKTHNPNKLRLPIAIILFTGALGFLGYRIHRLNNSTEPERLYLSSDVNLVPPTKVTGSDRGEMAAALTAEALLKNSAQAQPGNGQALLDLASGAVRANDLLTARSSLSRAIGLGGEIDSTMLDSLGQADIDLGLCQDAITIYQKAITRFPKDVTGYLGIAHTYSALNMRSEAMMAISKGSAALTSDDIAGHLALSIEYDKRQLTQRALEEAERAVSIAPKYAPAKLAAATLLIKLNRASQAEVLTTELLKSGLAVARAHRLMGQILMNAHRASRDVKLAEHHFLSALQLDANDKPSLEGLGQLCLEQKRYREAAFAYGKLTESAPNDAFIRSQVAQAYEKLGDAKTAKQQRALSLQLTANQYSESRLVLSRDANRQNPANRLVLARFYLDAGKFGQALIEIQAAQCHRGPASEIKELLTELYRALELPLAPDSVTVNYFTAKPEKILYPNFRHAGSNIPSS